MPQLHDKGYKRLFSNRTILRQLLETFVGEDWVKEVDFEKGEAIDKTFIDERYRTKESDLIYKLPLRDSNTEMISQHGGFAADAARPKH